MSWIMNQNMKKLKVSVDKRYLLFLRNICERKLTLQEADNKQNKLVSELKGINLVKKRSFLNNVRLFLGAREKVLNNFKAEYFQYKIRLRHQNVKHVMINTFDTPKTKRKISS